MRATNRYYRWPIYGSEINSIDLALTKMLTDTNKRTFGHFWTWNMDPADLAAMTMVEAMEIYEDALKMCTTGPNWWAIGGSYALGAATCGFSTWASGK